MLIKVRKQRLQRRVRGEEVKEVDSLQFEPHTSRDDGIIIKSFMKHCNELKTKPAHITERILLAFDIPVRNKFTTVDWPTYIRLMKLISMSQAT